MLAPLCTGIVTLGVLIIHQWKFKKDGLFHHNLFSMGRNFPLSVICVFVEGLSESACHPPAPPPSPSLPPLIGR